MALIRMFRRNRTDAAGSLGIVQRSIGYLQGGYKDTTIHSRVQLFNTVTQVGQIVYDTGYQRNYVPGISGQNSGYFSINGVTQYNKFNYVNASAFAVGFTTATRPGVTSVDFGIYSKAWVLTKPTENTAQETVNNWNSINLSTDTITSHGLIDSNPLASTRQATCTSLVSVFWNTVSTLTALNHATDTVSNIAGISAFTSIGYPCGMSRDNSNAYLVASVSNIKLTFSGVTIAAQTSITAFSYHFNESHSVSSATAGYMMAGYDDTTGRYGGTQHALCQKMTFADESFTTLSDLVIAQSSGQMMQGF